MKNLTLLFISFLCIKGYAQNYVDINAPLINVSDGVSIWGDYDNDGDLDCFVAGTDLSLNYISALYQNVNGSFVLVNNNLLNVTTQRAEAAWGDYDNDGDLDIIIESIIYNNNNGQFTDINAGIMALETGSVDWGDFDNDNDLDLILNGTPVNGWPNNYQSLIYRNDNGIFTDINAGFPGTLFGSVDWGDYDGDGDLDVLLVGELGNGWSPSIANIYQNNAGAFSLADTINPIYGGNAKWGDYDNDGDLDILISGVQGNNGGNIIGMSKVFTNNGGNNFSDANINLRGMTESYCDWVDYNGDGYLDIMLTGQIQSGFNNYLTEIYLNDRSGNFNITNHDFMIVDAAYFDWADYNNDGSLDLIICGANVDIAGFNYLTKIYSIDTCLDSIPGCGLIGNSTIEVPTIFTPNNDGINDQFKITTSNIAELNCKVFNRWGIRVAELKTPNDAWDGRTDNGLECTEGVYFLIIQYTNNTGKNSIEKGFIHLIK